MKALLPFSKYHGLGNDFVLLDARELARDASLLRLLDCWPLVVARLCDRNFGVGADGVILCIPLPLKGGDMLLRAPLKQAVMKPQKRGTGDYPVRHDRDEPERFQAPSAWKDYERAMEKLTGAYPDRDQCELAWLYTNSDGSPADMCGNGLRCLAAWAKDNLCLAENTGLKIATARGPVAAAFDGSLIEVDIGKPVLDAASIPVSVSVSEPVGVTLAAGGREYKVTAVGMGNPHCVIFGPDQLDEYLKGYEAPEPGGAADFFPESLKEAARAIQAHEMFPESVNVEFVRIRSRQSVDVLVYERGCGPTLACASGAAAVVVAGVLGDSLDRRVSVRLPGGELTVSYSADDEHVRIKGAACEVFSGVVRLDLGGLVANGQHSATEVPLS
ncbi:MAG: diaminopimelate epimerase [Candidatus Melainabacteria bacterium]|nr:diaminopimelate epimerase [Candidatus Melainabacteria bacterium]